MRRLSSLTFLPQPDTAGLTDTFVSDEERFLATHTLIRYRIAARSLDADYDILTTPNIRKA